MLTVKLRQRILNGDFGKRIAELFLQLSADEQLKIANLWERQLNSAGRRLYFEEAITVLFPCSYVYFYEHENKFVLCFPYDETEINKQRWELVAYLFLDVTARYELFWKKHVGIIGREKFMRIGKIAVY